jgi:hypothetical protein
MVNIYTFAPLFLTLQQKTTWHVKKFADCRIAR